MTNKVCEHNELETEQIEVDTMRNGEHDTYLRSVYVCMDCGEQVDGDPQEDLADDYREDD